MFFVFIIQSLEAVYDGLTDNPVGVGGGVGV